jgi:hypothetical protein
MTVPRNLVKFSGSVGGQIGEQCGGTEPAGRYTFFCRKENENRELGTCFLCIRESSAVKNVEFVSDRMILRCHWCHVIVLNVQQEIKLIM